MGYPQCSVELGGACSKEQCCKNNAVCFEQSKGQNVCLDSCTPGENSMCKTPSFAHPLAQARATWVWPDVACIAAPGTAFVKPEAMREKYGSCEKYCHQGAGVAVMQYDGQTWSGASNMWFATGDGIEQCCPGDAQCTRRGVKCGCSFPDRRLQS